MSDSPSQPSVEVKARADGGRTIQVKAAWKTLDSTLPNELSEMEASGALHPSVTPPRRKVAAARWFLQQLRRCIQHEGAALMFLEAYLAELRASTFSLQNFMAHLPGFDEWYTQQRESMKRDESLRWLVEARNSAQKKGLVFATWGPHTVVRSYRSGKVEAVRKEPTLTIVNLERTVTLDDLEQMVNRLSEIVETAHARFYPKPSDRKHTIGLEFVRETQDGSWEHYDPDQPPVVGVTRKGTFTDS